MKQQVKRKLLMDALKYHHSLNNHWTRIAGEGGTHEEYVAEFPKMREALIRYEYTVQIVLGINPSPLAEE